ncbi:hypothetical protein GIB67_002453 [Kingdonia uniflora]|uniref:Uncharacterized protein n=1 Tax=Kingdonia uniflora TaxID=39325 RepID=A0A7J7NCC0_9MAGN|nr:hypothetical protein GIB67_002453 [Kingdonia uniflora]
MMFKQLEVMLAKLCALASFDSDGRFADAIKDEVEVGKKKIHDKDRNLLQQSALSHAIYAHNQLQQSTLSQANAQNQLQQLGEPARSQFFYPFWIAFENNFCEHAVTSFKSFGVVKRMDVGGNTMHPYMGTQAGYGKMHGMIYVTLRDAIEDGRRFSNEEKDSITLKESNKEPYEVKNLIYPSVE